MRNLVKNKKKKGFTLIEMVAVVAIIGILAAILVPKVTKYMEDAKKTKVVGQARMINLAVETAIAKGHAITGDTKLNAIPNAAPNDALNTMLAYMEMSSTEYTAAFTSADGKLNKLDPAMSVNQCKLIGDGTDFELKTDGSGQVDISKGAIASK